MLERFRLAKQSEIEHLRTLEKAGQLPAPFKGKRPGFVQILKQKAPHAIIAEYKRASPSRGDINLEVSPEETATGYANAGAGALSVLTEERYFKGELGFLSRMAPVINGLPLLRKDFILDRLQVIQTASTPASAILLIVRMLDDQTLEELLRLCQELNLEPVSEVFDLQDLERAKKFAAKIIQVNNRDLDTLREDLETSRRLIKHKAQGEFWISASGISKPREFREMIALGFDAALVGSALMSGGSSGAGPGPALAALMQPEDHKG